MLMAADSQRGEPVRSERSPRYSREKRSSHPQRRQACHAIGGVRPPRRPPLSFSNVLRLRIHLGDELLISPRQVRVVRGWPPTLNQLRWKGVEHDRLEIEVCRVQLVEAVRLEDVEIDLFLAPIVGRAAEVRIDGLRVPPNAPPGVLMLVDRRERMTKFVQDDTAILLILGIVAQPAEIHRGLGRREGLPQQAVRSYGRPRAG